MSGPFNRFVHLENPIPYSIAKEFHVWHKWVWRKSWYYVTTFFSILVSYPHDFLNIKSALCTILAFNLCWVSRSPLRALDQPVVEEVLLDVVQRGDVVALPQELLKLYSVFCVLYYIFCILYCCILYSVFSWSIGSSSVFFSIETLLPSLSFIFLRQLYRVHIHKATDLQFLTKCQLVVWRDENIITL